MIIYVPSKIAQFVSDLHFMPQIELSLAIYLLLLDLTIVLNPIICYTCKSRSRIFKYNIRSITILSIYFLSYCYKRFLKINIVTCSLPGIVLKGAITYMFG